MDMKGTNIKVGDVVDYRGKYCIVEALISDNCDDLVEYKIYWVSNPSLSMHILIDDVTLVSSLKYKEGDIVKIIQSGWGLGAEWIGSTAILTKCRFDDCFDVSIYSNTGTCIQEETMVSDNSFQLIQRPEKPLTGGLFNPDEVALEMMLGCGEWVDYEVHRPKLRIKQIKRPPSIDKLLEIQELEAKIKELKSSL